MPGQMLSEISMRGGPETPAFSVPAFSAGSLANASACAAVGKSCRMKTSFALSGARVTFLALHSAAGSNDPAPPLVVVN